MSPKQYTLLAGHYNSASLNAAALQCVLVALQDSVQVVKLNTVKGLHLGDEHLTLCKPDREVSNTFI